MDEATKQKRREYHKQWHERNPGKRSEYLRRYRESHRDELLEIERLRRIRDKDKRQESAREYRAKNRERLKEYNRNYRLTHPNEHYRGRMRHHLKMKFGITEETYAKMLVDQFGRCAICHAPCPEDNRLHVDHNHETGQVRGLLCYGCNSGLGSFKDDIGRMKLAVAYLEQHQAASVS